jgi:1,4-dihydroxy-2-naphthoate octaprenyltransferase
MTMMGDDDDEEVALVCPARKMGVQANTASDNPTKKRDSKDGDSFISIQKMKQRLISQTYDCMIASIVLVIMLGLCVVSYFFCKVCLLGILILSACMCPWVPYFNIPLWISIVLLVFMGWNFTYKSFEFTWK